MNCSSPLEVLPPACAAGRPEIDVEVVAPPDFAWFDRQMAEHHYLGAGRPVGDYLRQRVSVRGRAVALLAWGPACYALKDRDRWLGWSATQRVERLKLIVQNRRFPPPYRESARAPSRVAGPRRRPARAAPAVAGHLRLPAAPGRELHRSGGA